MCDQPYWRGPLLICGENAVKSSVPFRFMVFYNTYTDSRKNCLEVDIYMLGRQRNHIRAHNIFYPLSD